MVQCLNQITDQLQQLIYPQTHISDRSSREYSLTKMLYFPFLRLQLLVTTWEHVAIQTCSPDQVQYNIK